MVSKEANRLRKLEAEGGSSHQKIQIHVDKQVSNEEWQVIDVDEDNHKNLPAPNQKKPAGHPSKQLHGAEVNPGALSQRQHEGVRDRKQSSMQPMIRKNIKGPNNLTKLLDNQRPTKMSSLKPPQQASKQSSGADSCPS